MDMKEYQVNESDSIIIATKSGERNIEIDKIKLLDSPTSFVKCVGEFKILDTGLYRIDVNFDEIGLWLYRIKIRGETIQVFKANVVEKSDTTIIRETLASLKHQIEQEDIQDDDRIDEIQKLVKIIFMKT